MIDHRISMLALAFVGLAAGCSTAPPPPFPYPMPPWRTVARAETATPDTIAVLDFVDARPDFELSKGDINEVPIGGIWLAYDRFWSFHADDATLERDPALAPDLRARVTGEAAFAWYPFPNPGIGKPFIEPVSSGLADYIALSLEQRHLFGRVVRCRDAEQARAAGAALILTGKVARFGAMLAEARDPFVVRPDDWTEWRLVAACAYAVELKRAADDQSLFQRECLGRDEDSHLFDALPRYAGEQRRPLWQLDAGSFPDFAKNDMGAHTRRSLERATAPMLAALEAMLTPTPPTQ